VTDPAATAAGAARAAAAHFAAEYGPGLAAQFDAELAARAGGDGRAGRYDPAVLAGLGMSAASLIVTIAQLAQSIRASHRGQAPEPSPQAIARQVRITLRERDIPVTEGTLRITDFIATEITRRDPHASQRD
jgi:hypothetical protein